jgi:hypothetical protein
MQAEKKQVMEMFRANLEVQYDDAFCGQQTRM